MPLYILHDLYFEMDGFKAQIDFLVFTPKICFIIECKNLYGNITVDNNGSFIRTIHYNQRFIKEGIYSPITQNERHLQMIKKIKMNQVGALGRIVLNKTFETTYKPIVVIANSKTVINAKYAQRNVKSKIIRADHLIDFMKTEYNKSKIPPSSDKATRQWAESFLNCNKENTSDYLSQYKEYLVEKETEPNNELLFNKLKAFRSEMAKSEKIAAYMVFNNKALDALIQKRPKTLEEIKEIPGFGEIKVQKYGMRILEIFSNP